jgi:Mannosyltransferase OCH1 and related enzymes
MMIPKIIHYCWFGTSPLPSLAVKCIESWKKHCPNYEIKEWNESNFDFNITRYSAEANETKNWAFVSDVARLYAVYNYGGIYFDVDVEVLKPIDIFLDKDMFIGFQSDYKINTGLGFGAIKNFYLIKEMLDFYTDMPFINADNTFNTTPCPVYVSNIMQSEGFILNNTIQMINNIAVLPTEYFCPECWYTGKINITDNTHLHHHFLASWLSNEQLKQHIRTKKQLVYKKNKEALMYEKR